MRMADSIIPGNMPMGYPAYLGYTDGQWPTAHVLPQMFAGAHVLTLTVTGGPADGVDCEGGDLTPEQAAVWLLGRVHAGQHRPVLYASRDTVPAVLGFLGAGVQRGQFRILSAHYGAGEHICGPHTCTASFEADGTQWSSTFPGVNGALIDMSVLADNFFDADPHAAWVFTAVRGLVGTHGPHSLRLTWSSPGQVAPEAVHHYQVTVRLAGRDIRGFPVTVPKTGVQESVQWDGVEAGSYDQAMVRAVAVDGHASPWASVAFRWPG